MKSLRPPATLLKIYKNNVNEHNGNKNHIKCDKTIQFYGDKKTKDDLRSC